MRASDAVVVVVTALLLFHGTDESTQGERDSASLLPPPARWADLRTSSIPTGPARRLRGGGDEVEQSAVTFCQQLLQGSLDANETMIVENAWLLSSKRRYVQQAFDLLCKAVKMFPSSARIHHSLGILHLQCSQNFVEAEYHLKRSCELEPSFTKPWCGIVYLRLCAGDMEEARASVEDVARKFPEDPKVCHDAAMLSLQMGQEADTEQGKRLLLRAIELRPNQSLSSALLASVYLDEEREDAAEKVLRDAYVLEPSSPLLLTALAELMKRRHKNFAASALYKRAIEVDPGLHPEIKAEYASFCTDVEEMNEKSHLHGGKLYRKAIAEMYETTEWGRLLNRSSLVHYLCRYGSMLSSLDQPSVRSWNREKRKEDEEDDESEVVRESIRGIEPLLDMEDFRPSSISEVVFRIFLKASKLEPRNSDALKGLGNSIFHSSKDLNKAEMLFRRVVAIDPQDGHSFANIAAIKLSQWLSRAEYSFAEENPFSHITPIVRHAVRLDPASAYVKYVHAVYMLRCEKNGSVAVEELRQAVMMEPNNQVYYGLLSNAFLQRADEYRAELVTDAQSSKWIIKRTEDYEAGATALIQHYKLRLKAEEGMDPEEVERDLAQRVEIEKQKSFDMQAIRLAIQSLRDDTYFSSLDKRTLSRSDWFTTIGIQGGTFFNVSRLAQSGALKGLEEQDKEWIESYTERSKQISVNPLQDVTGTLAMQRRKLLGLTGRNFPMPEVELKSLEYFKHNRSEESQSFSDADHVKGEGAVDASSIMTADVVGSEDVEAEIEKKLAVLAQAEASKPVTQPASGSRRPRNLEVEREAGSSLARVVEVPTAENKWDFEPSSKRPRILHDPNQDVPKLPVVIPELNAPIVDARMVAEEILSRYVEEDVFSVRIVGLNPDVDDEKLERFLQSLLGESRGSIKKVEVHFDEETGDSYGRATVSFTSRASADHVCNMLHNRCPEDIGTYGSTLQVKLLRK